MSGSPLAPCSWSSGWRCASQSHPAGPRPAARRLPRWPRSRRPPDPRPLHHPTHRPPRHRPRLRPGPTPLGRRTRLHLAARLQTPPHPLRTPSRPPPRATPTRLRTDLLPAAAGQSEMTSKGADGAVASASERVCPTSRVRLWLYRARPSAKGVTSPGGKQPRAGGRSIGGGTGGLLLTEHNGRDAFTSIRARVTGGDPSELAAREGGVGERGHPVAESLTAAQCWAAEAATAGRGSAQ
jgi:hypothetical protein